MPALSITSQSHNTVASNAHALCCDEFKNCTADGTNESKQEEYVTVAFK
jgi:hypothetical protein